MKWSFHNYDWLEIQGQAKREANACMTEAERKEYQEWPEKLKNILQSLDNAEQQELSKTLNMRIPRRDALHADQRAANDISLLEREFDETQYRAYKQLTDALPQADMLDLAEEIRYTEHNAYGFHDKNLEQCLLSLKEKQRQVIDLSVLDGIKTKDIAEQTETSERNIRQLRQRGIDNLRKNMPTACGTSSTARSPASNWSF